EHPLRSNTVHTLTRENTGANVGYRVPIVDWVFGPGWDGLDVKCVPKGSGSESMTFLKMLVPADGVNGIKRFVLASIVEAGGKPGPPGIVGGGMGGGATRRARGGWWGSGSAARPTTRCTSRRRRSPGRSVHATPTRSSRGWR